MAEHRIDDNTQAPVVDAGRRGFLKTASALAAAPMVLTSRKGGATDPPLEIPPSPDTIPWQEELPTETPRLEPVPFLSPEPTEQANTEGGECGRGDHQRWAELYDGSGPVSDYADLYELRAVEHTDWVFHPDYPPQPIWGFEGDTEIGPVLNPTIHARYGRPVICRLYNDLPQDHVGFGSPEVSMHLHNLHAPSESDGFPGDYFSPLKAGPTLRRPGSFNDYCYPNVYAGLDEYGGIGDPREALGTLWYHDHTLDFTAPNATRGLAGFYLLFDDIDSGDERDLTPGALRLPSHPYDYPLVFQDRRFDLDGIHYFDQFDPEGTLGDKVTVNGKIEPVLRVAARKYRLRLLNAGPTRLYRFHLVTADNQEQSFRYIANDGNLLPRALTRRRILLGMAERADIVVNFSRYPIGTELYLVNRLRQDSTRKPDGVVVPGTRVLKIIVDRSAADPSRVPSALRPLPPLDPLEIAAAPVRRWVFGRRNGMWTVNDRFVNALSPDAEMVVGSAEVWELVNPSGGWVHPVHIHFEEGRILSKTVDGVEVPVPVHERGRKDVFVLGKNTTMRVFLRFRDFLGKYVMHCHNLTHEDHAMMVRWDVIPAEETASNRTGEASA